MLPGRDGIETLESLRAGGSRTPVLLLTARDAVADRVLGLDSGADDYLVKPFAFPELLARLRVLLRRAGDTESLRRQIGDLVLDIESRRVYRSSQEIILTLREFDLLAYFMRHHDQTFTRRMLAKDVWRESHRITPLDNVFDVQRTNLEIQPEHRKGSMMSPPLLRHGVFSVAPPGILLAGMLTLGVHGAELDQEAIEKAAGTQAAVTADGVVRIGWTRDDVPVTVDGVKFPPTAGLGSWAAFMPTGHEAMVMGDTVVFQDEVSPAMDAAFAHGLEVSALHNHFFFDEPKVYFMHIGGQGGQRELAAGVKAVWDAIKQVRRQNPQPAKGFGGPIPQPGEGRIDTQLIERLTGLKPSANPGGVMKVSVGRDSAMHGSTFGGSMGLTTWAAFSGSDRLAAIDGDFAMTADEVQPVLRAMRKADLHVVALHNHMIGETPAYYFVHFWGTGPTEELAQAFKSVLEVQAASHQRGAP